MQSNLLEKLKSINASIKKKEFSPIYFLYGDETFFITSIIQNIKKEFVDNIGMNTKLYDDENFDVDEVVDNIENMPLMNDKKLIIFRNIELFRKKKKNEIDKKNEELILGAIEKAININIIIIALEESEYKYQEKYIKGNKFFDFSEKYGIVLDSKKLTEEELSKYVQGRFKKGGFTIDPVDLSYFVRNAGKNIYMLYSEADKIMSYFGDGKKITKADIDKCISRNVEDNVFSLIDLVNNHKIEDAYKLYGDLLSEGVNEFVIFSLFSTNFENLLLVKDLTEQSKTLKDICEITKFPDWKVRKLQNANKGMTKESLISKLEKITKLNFNYMKGNINANLMTELLLV